jgi:hypothetical protein
MDRKVGVNTVTLTTLPYVLAQFEAALRGPSDSGADSIRCQPPGRCAPPGIVHEALSEALFDLAAARTWPSPAARAALPGAALPLICGLPKIAAEVAAAEAALTAALAGWRAEWALERVSAAPGGAQEANGLFGTS